MGTFTITQTTPNKDKLLLRPNANSTCTSWTTGGINQGLSFECINEEIPNYYINYIRSASTTGASDVYPLPDSSDLGTINYVKVAGVCRAEYPPPPGVELKLLVADADNLYPPDEDFTTYTVVDEGCGHIDVVSAAQVDARLYRNHSDYCYKDLGVGTIGSTFTHCCAVRFGADNHDSAYGGFDGCSDTVGVLGTWSNGIYHRWYQNRLYLTVSNVLNGSASDYYTCSKNTWYYLKTIRDGAGNVNCYIYSDEAMTALVDTLTCANDNPLISFRYKYAVCTHDSGENYYIDLEFKDLNLACGDNCTSYTASGVENVNTSWRKITNIWTTNPDTSAAWTWNDIDDMYVGVYGKSKEILNFYHTETLRPNGAGYINQWCNKTSGCTAQANNYLEVDEETTDEDVSYVYVPSTVTTVSIDAYALSNTTGSGVIQSITVFGRSKAVNTSMTEQFRYGFRTGGTNYFKTGWATNSWWTLSNTWTTNPDTGLAWTWADLDALEVLIHHTGTWGDGDEVRCTQVYVVVDYTDDGDPIPEIQCTQLYAEVGYDPSTATCTLNLPNEASLNHQRNSKIWNFWDGSREVYDYNRSGKSLQLQGSESSCNSQACTRMTCVRNLGRNGAIVTLAGLPLDYYNGDYRIRQFGWKKIGSTPDHYEWVMTLEAAVA